MILHLLLGAFATLAAVLGAPDADCANSNYVTLTEPRRLLTSGGTLCDNQLQKRWYRFTSPGGQHLAVGSRSVNSCGTNFPLFIADASFNLPPPADYSTRSTKVCADFGSGCDWQATIRLKRCDGFVLYELVPTPGCDMAYCTQDALNASCALGEFRNPKTGRCIEPPPVAVSVSIDKPLVATNLSTFSFPCRFRLSSAASKHGHKAMAAVYAMFDGRLDPTHSVIVDSSLGVALISGTRLKGHIPSQVACGVVGLWKEIGRKYMSRVIQSSNSYAAKIEMYLTKEPHVRGKEILLKDHVTLNEDDLHSFILRSTIPVTFDTHNNVFSNIVRRSLHIGIRTVVDFQKADYRHVNSGTRHRCLTGDSGVWDYTNSFTQFKAPLRVVSGLHERSDTALLQLRIEMSTLPGFSIWEGVKMNPIAIYPTSRTMTPRTVPNYCYCTEPVIVCEQDNTIDPSRKSFKLRGPHVIKDRYP